jgi:ATP-binding cassette subfamily F protein uup
MAIISLQDVSLRMGGEPLLDHVTLHIEKGQRACLTGRNGCGKSTLLKVLADLLQPDAGEVIRSPGFRISYLPQDIPNDLTGTVQDVVDQVSDDTADTYRAHSQSGAEAIQRLHLCPTDAFLSLSGGTKRRVLLARALASSPDLLLLDEPTNHLDVQAIIWLEKFLIRSGISLLFVTHDRAFLRNVATKIFDLDRGELAGWDCDYDTFLIRKEQLLADEEALWEKKGKRLSQEEAWIRKGIKARRTRDEGRVRALEALREEFRKRRLQSGNSSLTLQNAGASGALVVKAESVSFAYEPDNPLITNLDLQIMRGEKVGIIGPNGSGKTTLLRLILGEIQPVSGSLQLGTRLQIARIDQLRAALALDKTVLENISGDGMYVEVNGQQRHAFGYLQQFLFTPERARTPVKILSGGEKNRLLLAMAFTQPFNFLLMDEPTNDLDLETLCLLEEQIQEHPATMLIVSHDREFLNRTVVRTIVLEGEGRIGKYAGGYDDYLSQSKAQNTETTSKAKSDKRSPKATVVKDRKLTNRERAELENIPNQIEAWESEQQILLLDQADANFYKQSPDVIATKQMRLSELTEHIESAMERWAELESISIGTTGS